MKFPLALAVLLASAVSLFAQPAGTDGVKAAIAAVPAHLRDGIVKITADNGKPNPPTWYVLAKNASDEVFSVSIADGQVTEEKPSLNLRALFGQPSPINLGKLTIGSDGAWAAAQSYVAKKGKTLGSVSYALEQKGRNAAPLWSIWCYGPDGSYIGYLEILATTGAVVSSE